MFDAGGLFLGSNSGSFLVPDTAVDRPGGFYAARLSSYAAWSRSVAPLPEPPVLERAVSRKTHGAAGTFDVDLPATAPLGVECRLGNTLLLVFMFDHEIAHANVELREGSMDIAAATIAGTQLLLSCNAVANAQWITVALTDVADTEGGILEVVPARFGVLAGDVTGNRYVTSADITSVKTQAGNLVHAGNFRTDLNASGYLTSADISAVKSLTGSMLP